MITYEWLCGFVLLAICIHASAGGGSYRAPAEYRATREEAMAFFEKHDLLPKPKVEDDGEEAMAFSEKHDLLPKPKVEDDGAKADETIPVNVTYTKRQPGRGRTPLTQEQREERRRQRQPNGRIRKKGKRKGPNGRRVEDATHATSSKAQPATHATSYKAQPATYATSNQAQPGTDDEFGGTFENEAFKKLSNPSQATLKKLDTQINTIFTVAAQFNKENFFFDQTRTIYEHKKQVVEVWTTQDRFISLPGKVMTFKGKICRIGYRPENSRPATFTEREYAMIGDIEDSKRGIIWAAVKLHKPVKMDEFILSDFNPLKQFTWLKNLFQSLFTKFGTQKVINYWNELTFNAENLFARMCFKKDILQLDLELRQQSGLNQLINATKINFIVTQEKIGSQTKETYAALVQYTQLEARLAEAFGKYESFSNNKWLSSITGSGCLILVNDETRFLKLTKKNNTFCFGSQHASYPKEIEIFQKLRGGIYVYMEAKFGQLANTCWEDPNHAEDPLYYNPDPAYQQGLAAPMRLDFDAAKQRRVTDYLSKKALKILLTLTDKRPKFEFIHNATVAVDLFLFCLGGAIRNMPAILTGGELTLDAFQWQRKDDGKTFVQFGATAMPTPKREHYPIVPGEPWKVPYTNIELASLTIAANNKWPDPADRTAPNPWTYAGGIEVVFPQGESGDEKSNIAINFNYTVNVTILTITSERITIADILRAFFVTIDKESVLTKLGVSSFFLMTKWNRTNSYEEIKKGVNSNPQDYSPKRSSRNQDIDIDVTIRGRPIVLDFESLQISALINRKAGDIKYAVGVYLDGADFTPMINYFLPEADISLSWLSGLKILFVINNMDENVTLQHFEPFVIDENEIAYYDALLSIKEKNPYFDVLEFERIYGTYDANDQGRSAYNLNAAGTEAVNPDMTFGRTRHNYGRRRRRSVKKSQTGKVKGTSRRDIPSWAQPQIEKDLAKQSGKKLRKVLLFENILNTTFNNLPVDKGWMFVLSWKIPTNTDECKGSTVCEWLSEHIAQKAKEGQETTRYNQYSRIKQHTESTVQIYAKYVPSPISFELYAQLNTEVHLNDDKTATFKQLLMTFKYGGLTLPSFAIIGNLEYKYGENLLNFTGSLTATMVSLQITLTMEGFMPIGNYILLGDMKVSGTLSAKGVSFEFGCTIKLGVDAASNPHIMVIRGDMRIALGDPTQNYISAKFSALSIGAVCNAFQFEKCEPLPDSIKNTGFPKGVEISYRPKSTPGLNIDADVVGSNGETIPEGLWVKGTLNVLGLESYAELSVTDEGFKADIEPGPINWAYGMIQVMRGKEGQDTPSDPNLGPKGSMKLGQKTIKATKRDIIDNTEVKRNRQSGVAKKVQDIVDFEFEFKGCISLFGYIWAYVDIKIEFTYIKFHLAGSLIPGLLDGEIYLEAGWSDAKEHSSPFKFKLSITESDSGLQKSLNDFLRLILYGIRVIVQAFLALVDGVISTANTVYWSIGNNTQNWEDSIKKWEANLKDRQTKIKNKDANPPTCKCDLVCLPFMDWNPKCWQIWGKWVGCPFWNSCFAKVEDPLCKLACIASAVATTFSKWAQQALLALESLILEGSKALLEVVLKVRDFAKDVRDKAVEIKTSAESRLPEILISKKPLPEDIIRITNVTIWAELDESYKACVGYFYDVTFMQNNYKGDGEACLDIIQFVKDLATSMMNNEDGKTKGVTSATEIAEESEESAKDVGEDVQEAERKEAGAKEKVDAEVNDNFNSDDFRRRADIPALTRLARGFRNVLPQHVPTEKEMETQKLLNGIPPYDIRDNPEARSAIYEPAWTKLNAHVSVGHNRTVQTNNELIEKRTLDFGTHLSPCARMKRALNGYSDLTEGLLRYASAVEKSSQDMEATNMANNKRLEKAKRDIDATVEARNVTGEHEAQAYHYFHQVTASYNELARKSDIAVKTENVHAIPIIRRHLNDLLTHEKGTTFLKYTEMMHSNAVQGYKRSQIPDPAKVKGEETLGNIKMELQSIMTTDGSYLTPMKPRLTAVKKDIVAMTKVTDKCQS